MFLSPLGQRGQSLEPRGGAEAGGEGLLTGAMAFGRGTWPNCRDQEWAKGHTYPSLTFLPPSISWQCLSWWNQVPVPWAVSLRSFQDTVQSRGRWRVELVGVSVNHPDLKLRFFCWCEHGVKSNKPREWALPTSWAEKEQAQRVDGNPCH